MKKVVVFTRSVLLLSTFLLILLFGGTNAKALTYDKAISLEMVTNKYTSPNLVTRIDLDDPNDQIANVRTSSKKLKAVVSFTATGMNTCYEEIQMYATKRGKYKLYFDVVDKDGNVKSSETITVYVRTVEESLDAIKSIKVGKTEIKNQLLKDKYTTRHVDVKKSGKLKIKMKKGCKLKEIYVTRYEKLGSPETSSDGTKTSVKTIAEYINNGSMLVLSNTGYKDGNVDRSGNQICEKNRSIFGYTKLWIAYTDKKGALTTRIIVLRSVIK